ncbi:MAG: adenylate kinase [Ignavibacteriota bacterium]|nr:MAG: adenylate kinase [Ignavibacteriota bacterium]
MMAITNFPAILMFGGPGTGKGTQGTILGRVPNLAHLAMGDIFRALDPASELGREFLAYSTKGLLVPDAFTVRLFQQHVGELVDAGKLRASYHTLLLDGIPRTTTQVELLRGTIDVRRIIHLVVDDREALVARLGARARKANRPDDADPSVIRKRLDVYDSETRPVLEAYPPELVRCINGDQHPLAVLRDVASALIPVVPGSI